MRQSIGVAAVIVSCLLVTSASPALAETSVVEDQETLTRAMQGAWLPLEGGLMASH